MVPDFLSYIQAEYFVFGEIKGLKEKNSIN